MKVRLEVRLRALVFPTVMPGEYLRNGKWNLEIPW